MSIDAPQVPEPAEAARVRSVMEDPSARAIAAVYADAFLQAAGDGGADDALAELTALHDDVLKKHPDFLGLLASPLVNTDHKVGLIDRVIAPGCGKVLANFLRVLARHGRLDLIPSILAEAHVRNEARHGKKRVTVTTAVPLSGDELNDLERRLGEAVSFTPVLVPEVDPDILGGMVIRVDDTVFDSSLKARLRQLRGRLDRQATHALSR